MKIDQALKILHSFQRWRRGANNPMPNPTLIGQAIDEAIRVMRKVKRENNE